MKTASAELIAFLASGKAFVMWDTFTFTLADGTQLVYDTRDPDAPALPTVAPPDYTLLLDTFNGTGTLADHIGEQSADWLVANPGRELDLADFVVSDGYILTLGDEFVEVPLLTQWAPTGSNSSLYMRANVAVNAASQGIRLGLTANSGAEFAELRTYIDNGANGVGARVFLSAALYGVTSDYSNLSFETSLTPNNTPHDYRLELSSGRNTITILVDGVAMITGNLAPGDSLGTVDSTYFLPEQAFSPGGPIVFELQGGTL